MSNYRRGRELEYEVKALFEAAGWCVVRGSSSKGTFVIPLDQHPRIGQPYGYFKPDLICTKASGDTRTIFLIAMQAKRSKN